MAVFTSAQTGNWSADSTWVGTGVPTTGDTAIIADGHTVTVDENTSVGTGSDPVVDAITCQDDGQVVIGTDNTLTVSGDITVDNNPLTLNAGATLTFATGTTGLLHQFYSNTSGQSNAGFICNGTSGNRCTVNKTGTGSARIYIWYGYSAVDCTYTDFENMGDASNNAVYVRRSTLSFVNCRFDTCYQVGNATTYFYPDEDVIFSYCNFKNGQGTYDIVLRNQSTSTITGTRTIEHCSIRKGLQLTYRWPVDIEHCYINKLLHTAQQSTADYITSLSYCVIATDDDFSTQTILIDNCYRIALTSSNEHFFICSSPEGTEDVTYQNCILEHLDERGIDVVDGILESAAISYTGTPTITIKNNIVLPSNDTTIATSTICTINENVTTNRQFVVDNNTFHSAEGGGLLYAAHGAGVAGRIQSFKNNLAYAGATVSESYLMTDLDETPATGYVASGGADYNAYIDDDITTAYRNSQGGSPFASTPGTNDLVDEAPNFVDNTRNLSEWSENELGNTGTKSQLETSALNSLAAINDPDDTDYDADATIENLVTWVRDGYSPQNSDYSTSGSGGGLIGAVAVTETGAALAGEVELNIGVDADLNLDVSLSSSMDLQVDVDADLSQSIPLTATTDLDVEVTGNLEQAIPLASTTDLEIDIGADLGQANPLSATTDMDVDINADLSIESESALAGDVDLDVDIDADLSLDVALSASMGLDVDIDSELSQSIPLSSTTDLDIDILGNLQTDAQVSLSGSIELDIGADADLLIAVPLAASMDLDVDIVGNIEVTSNEVALAGAANLDLNIGADLSLAIPLGVSVDLDIEATANLRFGDDIPLEGMVGFDIDIDARPRYVVPPKETLTKHIISSAKNNDTIIFERS